MEVENVHRNIAEHKPLLTAILDGARQIAVPTFVATLTIAIVFVAVTFLDGVAKFLFTPLALAVVIALGMSYFLSRTLVPTMIRFLLASEAHETPNIYANIQGRDLGSVVREVEKVVDEMKTQQTPGNTIVILGQAESMKSAFERLGLGLVFAALLVYMLLVVNFQSWTDPAIILSVLPGALAGVVAGLYFTHTTFSVPGLMGAIMSLGVASANSILLVTFANDRARKGPTR